MEYLREDLARKYGEILPHLRTINSLEKKIAEEKSKISKVPDLKLENKFRSVGTVLLCVGIIIFLVSLLLLLSGYTAAAWLIGVMCGCYMIIPGIILKATSKSEAKVRTIQYEIEAHNKAIDQYKKTYENELNTVAQLIDIVPPGYRYELAVEFMYNCFLNQRADSVKEAINLYEEQLHRWKMENIAEQNMRLQEQQASYLNSIRGMTNVNTAINVADAISRLF